MAYAQRISFQSEVRSLHWVGDTLVDYVGGGQAVGPDGTYVRARVFWAFGFDRVVVSPSGRVQILYVETGTKAVVTSGFKVIREINRSYYCANSYEYPICVFALGDGREVIAHCPDEYNRLEIEEIDSGRRLTARDPEPPDVFHSRLRASPDGRRVLSAGWFWHPFGLAQLLDVGSALDRSESLGDQLAWTDFPINGEVEAACWLDDDRIAISTTSAEPLGEAVREDELQPNEFGIWSIQQSRWISRCAPAQRVGTMHELDGYVLGLFDHPKLLDPVTGQVVRDWPDIATGSQESSIKSPTGPKLPAVAVDSQAKRFAVSDGHDVTVVTVVTE